MAILFCAAGVASSAASSARGQFPPAQNLPAPSGGGLRDSFPVAPAPAYGGPGEAAGGIPGGLAGGPSVAPAAPGKLVDEVKVVGNKTTPLTKIQSYIKTRKGRDFDPEMVQADVRRLTQSSLFRDVRTSTQPTPSGGVIVTFTVIERPVIGEILFIGNKGLTDKTLLKQSDLKKGDSLNQYSVEEARRKVEEYYHTKGHPKTTVTILEGNQPQDRRVVFLIDEDQLQRIESVGFVGNTIASDDRLKTLIESKPGFLWYFFSGKVDRKKIDEDIEKLTAYYRSLGYFRARISREMEFDPSNSWLTLTFVIDEGPRYEVRSVAVIGNDKFTTDRLMEKLELKSGEYFNQARMNRDVNSIRDTYGSEGYIFADIQADPRFLEEPGQLDLVYRIKEGEPWRVGTINVKIAGDYPHTRHSAVLNRISLRPGDLIDIREVRRSEQRLKASQLFEIDPSKGSPPQLAVIPPDLKDLEEAPIRRTASGPRKGSATRGQTPNQE